MGSELPADAPIPRLCHLVKWPDFDGYGFNLHAEKSRQGQFIGKVDDDSPAMLAGLREGDRIVEVNGVNIANENHRQVVERIKSVSGETKLLVVDEAADRWFKERKIVVKSTLSNVSVVKTPVPRPDDGVTPPPNYENVSVTPNGEEFKRVGNGVEKHSPLTERHEGKPQQNGSEPLQMGNGGDRKPSVPSIHEVEEENEEEEEEYVEETASPLPLKTKPDSPLMHSAKDESNNHSRSSTPQSATVPDSPTTSTHSSRSTNSAGAGSAKNGTLGGGRAATPLEDGMLNLNMSAHEMRQMLANRRNAKKDPKKEPMDIRQKYEIIQQM